MPKKAPWPADKKPPMGSASMQPNDALRAKGGLNFAKPQPSPLPKGKRKK